MANSTFQYIEIKFHANLIYLKIKLIYSLLRNSVWFRILSGFHFQSPKGYIYVLLCRKIERGESEK